jgi:hypothetical protein
MVMHLCSNSTPKPYYGCSLILSFPPCRKNITNPFSWMRFGLSMLETERGGGHDRGVSASYVSLLPNLFLVR